MFQEFYGFTSLPFSRIIATKDLFPIASQKELGAHLHCTKRSAHSPAPAGAPSGAGAGVP